jgi:hypothetical protein
MAILSAYGQQQQQPDVSNEAVGLLITGEWMTVDMMQ